MAEGLAQATDGALTTHSITSGFGKNARQPPNERGNRRLLVHLVIEEICDRVDWEPCAARSQRRTGRRVFRQPWSGALALVPVFAEARLPAR